MPNWVYNGLTIEGNPDQVKSLMAQMNKPFKQMHDSWNMETQQMEKKVTLYSEPIFAFHNIYNYMDAGITEEAYLSQPPHNPDMKEWFKFEGSDWYNFNVREWGTKWDVAKSADGHTDTYMEDSVNGENHVVFYNFNTAWARPMEALIKLSKQYPNLLMTLSYEEETGWGGELELLNGVVISESEYETLCRECDAIDTLEYCENDCGEICSSCNYTDDLYAEAAQKCQTHMVLLPSTEKAEI